MTFRTPILLATAGLIGLTACTDPSTQTDDPRKRTKEGAVVGGLVGGVLGAVVGGNDAGERTRGAVIGGIVGAGVGAAVGYNLDKQAAELQRDFSDGRIQIINNGDSLTVRMPQDVLFAVDSSQVNASLRSDLAVLADSLQAYPGSTVQIIGHTDNTGGADYNQRLSVQRAQAVGAVLVSNGVPNGRISAIGRGESSPIASNLTAEGRAQNRRVDINIIPN